MAPADVVVIELPPEHTEARAAVQSCAWVLGEGRCRSSTESGPVPTWHAVVVWDDPESLQGRIEIRRHTDQVRSVQERKFTSADTLSQRYSALGLVIVSHVVAASAKRDDPEIAPVPVRPLAWGLDAALQLGPGVEADQLRVGALLRGWINPFSAPLRPALGFGWATSENAVQATWFDAALGAALHLEIPKTPLAFELRLEGVAQRTLLRAQSDEASERRWLTRYGARTGLEVFAGVTPGFALFVAGQGSYFAPEYVVDVQDRRRGAERAPTWGTLLGVRIAR